MASFTLHLLYITFIQHCVVRLEAYERNFNFITCQSLTQTDYCVTQSEASLYRDVSATAEVRSYTEMTYTHQFVYCSLNTQYHNLYLLQIIVGLASPASYINHPQHVPLQQRR